MQITKHKVVTMDYTLTDDAGSVIDSSKGGEKLSFIHGLGNLVPGLENELEGKKIGDSFKVSIAPEDGYGVKDESLTQAVPKDRFENIDEIQAGMQFQTETEAGPQIVTVIEVDEENVTVDTNHPLAGMTLNFEVDVIEVRDASEEEISHGHAHGPDGHAHD